MIARSFILRRALYLSAAVCLIGVAAWQFGVAISFRGTKTAMPDPEEGKVALGKYENSYFGMTYRLPQDWTVGEMGPGPSQSGYYVLSTLAPKSGSSANVLIAAEDMFFGADTRISVKDRTHDFQQAVANVEGMTVDRDLTEIKTADRILYRVDYSGVGLFRTRLATDVRCHVVSLNVTARDREELEHLAGRLDSLSFASGHDGDFSPPPCVRDYAVGDNVQHKVDPHPAGPNFVPIPVRIIVGADGNVQHVHVIRATDEQRRSIEEALYQWKLKPYEINGHPSPVETGLVFKFTPDN